MKFSLLLLGLLTLQTPSTETDRFEPVRAALTESLEKGSYLAVVAAVEVGGERVFEHAAGGLDVDAIFRIYSMTKPITAVAAMILVEEGKLDLDAPVSMYLPEFADVAVAELERDPETRERSIKEVPVEEPMTVRDLFRHTSGLTYGFFGLHPVDLLVVKADLYSGDLKHLTRELSRLPLKHQPGTRFEYSLSADVLGRVIEVVSEESLDAFFEQRLFDPLGMEDTGFFVPRGDLDRLATAYIRKGGELVEQTDTGSPRPDRKPKLFLGGAGLYSTADDYLRFCQMILGDGVLDGARILSEESLDEMLEDQLGERPGSIMLAGGGFGLGFAVVGEQTRAAGPSPGTVWWGGAAGTGFWIDREREIAGVFMIQSWMEIIHWHAFQSAFYAVL